MRQIFSGLLSRMFSSRFIVWLLAAIVGMHAFALLYSWYWIYLWLDMPMHFLGGTWAALVFFVLVRHVFRIMLESGEGWFIVLSSVSFSALVGVLWEFFEFCYDTLSKGYQPALQLGTADTMSDLFFDLLGGFVVGLLFLQYYAHQRRSAQSI